MEYKRISNNSQQIQFKGYNNKKHMIQNDDEGKVYTGNAHNLTQRL
jgi:hypothetical protein